MNPRRCTEPKNVPVQPRNTPRYFALLLALTTLPALADEDADVVHVRPVPSSVAAVTRCDEIGPGTTSRRIFSGFIVFAVECQTVRLNFRHEVVVADEMSGEGARLITFPKAHRPNAGDPEGILYTMDFLDSGEIAELFIDPAAVGIACRHVARWRLTGDAPAAKLVHWRETADCSGETGWRVLVGE